MPVTVKSKLPAIATELLPLVDAAMQDGAELVAERARANVPVGAPEVHIKDDITVEKVGVAEYAVVAGGDETFYGHMLEHGTSHSAPRPFLIPALEESRDEILVGAKIAMRVL